MLTQIIRILFSASLVLLPFLSACTQASTTGSTSSVSPAQTVTELSTLAATLSETTTVPATSSSPPASFQSEILRPGILPSTYIDYSCRYLELRWDPALSAPGTVVAVIMFHSILEGSNPPDLPQDINKEMFDAIIQLSEKLNFETITSEELLNFLQGNAKIPERSMMLILDDRRPGTAEDYFLPVLQENGWTATLAWIAADSGENLWTWIERLNATGYFDIQSHGLGQNGHIPITDQMSEAEVRQEIEGSIPVLMEHFGVRPLAIIWPGGNYTELGVQVAREAGFELGFTVHSRGPLMFNWIPQGEKERGMGEPFMTLPRFWDTAALLNLEQTVQISDAAREFARENYAEEAAWYAENCSGELPPLEAVLR